MTTFDHPPRILFLYGSLRDRSYSRLVAEAARIIEGFGAETRFFDPRELERIYEVNIKNKAIAQNSPIATRLTTKNSAINIIHTSWRES